MVSKMMREQSSGPPRTSKHCRERYKHNFVDGRKKSGIPSSGRIRICVRVGLWSDWVGKDLTDVTGVCVCSALDGRGGREDHKGAKVDGKQVGQDRVTATRPHRQRRQTPVDNNQSKKTFEFRTIMEGMDAE